MTKSPDAFRTISEVAEWLDTPAHVLRFWESKFAQVKPVKRAGGRRYYRPSDMELLGGIKRLLHDDGMTIKGVQKILSERGVKAVSAMSQPVDAAAGDGPPASATRARAATDVTRALGPTEFEPDPASEAEDPDTVVPFVPPKAEPPDAPPKAAGPESAADAAEAAPDAAPARAPSDDAADEVSGNGAKDAEPSRAPEPVQDTAETDESGVDAAPTEAQPDDPSRGAVPRFASGRGAGTPTGEDRDAARTSEDGAPTDTRTAAQGVDDFAPDASASGDASFGDAQARQETAKTAAKSESAPAVSDDGRAERSAPGEAAPDAPEETVPPAAAEGPSEQGELFTRRADSASLPEFLSQPFSARLSAAETEDAVPEDPGAPADDNALAKGAPIRTPGDPGRAPEPAGAPPQGGSGATSGPAATPGPVTLPIPEPDDIVDAPPGPLDRLSRIARLDARRAARIAPLVERLRAQLGA